MSHPQTGPRHAAVRETLHGVDIVDPFRWLEDAQSPETREWVADQNAASRAVLDAIPGRDALTARLRQLLEVGAVGSLREVKGCFFYTKREAGQDQPVLRMQDGLDAPPRILVDPTTYGEDGLTSLDWWFPSPDGALLCFGLSRHGDEWSTLHLLQIASGEVLPDRIHRARYASVAWLPDSTGFYYTRYPEPGTVPPGQEHYNSHLFFHRLGVDPADDPEIFGQGRAPEDMIGARISANGRWLVASAFQGWSRSEIYLLDREHPDDGFTPVAAGIDAVFADALVHGDRLYLLTNLDAPNYRVIAVDLDRAGAISPAEMATVIAERPDRVIEAIAIAGDRIVTEELERAIAHLRLYDLAGNQAGELDLPGPGSIGEIDADTGSRLLCVTWQSFTQPPTGYVFDTDRGTRVDVSPVALPAGYDPAGIVIEQVSYPSMDGTPISMFVVRSRDVPLDGSGPAYLTGYGGFNISRGSEYTPVLPAWLEQGGVFALPNLRGGGEYGEAWHRAGMREQKQHVFDDFIAAAEWLIDNGYTSRERLAISGRSNGGLLVGAVMTQRPDLYRAVYCGVPLLDMLRYDQFSIARLWIPEYGTAEEPDDFAWLHAYSPYHHVEDGALYPAVLFDAAEEDSRVDALHARKMTALMQERAANGPDRPILLRIESQAGHGQGKPLHKRVAQEADQWGFLGWQVGIDWGD